MKLNTTIATLEKMQNSRKGNKIPNLALDMEKHVLQLELFYKRHDASILFCEILETVFQIN